MSRHILTRSRTFAAVASFAGFVLSTANAFASQGPGIAEGTASTTTQLGMAIAVYGTSALVVAAGLIGAVRQR